MWLPWSDEVLIRAVNYCSPVRELLVGCRLHFEAEWVHYRAEVALQFLRTSGNDINRVDSLSRTKINSYPFLDIGASRQLATIAVNRRQRTIGGISQYSITNPLSLPFLGAQQPHGPARRVTPPGSLSVFVPCHHLPEAFLPRSEGKTTVLDLHSLIRQNSPAIP